MRLISILFFFILAESALANGGYVIGNGGNVLKCSRNGKLVYLSYDLEEGKILRNLNPIYSSKSNYTQKIKDILSRISDLNPSRTQMYLEWLENFEKESNFINTPVDLISVADTSVGLKPTDCELVQAIVQSNQPVGNHDKRYIINQTVWKKLNENQRSALVLHELIYREATLSENRHPNSYYVRLFNQMIFADRFARMSLKQYITTLQDLHFSLADAHAVPIQLTRFNLKKNEIVKLPVEFWDEHSIKMAHVYWRSKNQYQDLFLNYNCTRYEMHLATEQPEVHFYPNHKIQVLNVPTVSPSGNPACNGSELNLKNFGLHGALRANYFEFDQNGQISYAQSFRVQGPILSLKLSYGNLTITSNDASEIIFRPNEGFLFLPSCQAFSPLNYTVQLDGITLNKRINKISLTKEQEPKIEFCQNL